MRKRIISIILALVMVTGLMPSFTITADAAGGVTLLVNTSVADDSATRGPGAKYKTLAGAITKAVSGDTIKFETNCTIGACVAIEGKMLTLDLNDKLITCDVGNYYAINVGNGGTLTVTDTANGLGKISYSTPMVITSNGTINVAGGTIEANSAEKGPAIQNSSIDGTINVSGGTVSLDIGGSEAYGAINSFGTVNISGGTVVGTGNTPAIKAVSLVNVTGGNINTLSLLQNSIAYVTGGNINLVRIISGSTAYVTGGSINTIYNDGTLQNLNSQSLRLYTFIGGDPDVAVSSLSVTPALGYTYGLNGVKTDDNGKIYVWLPTGITNASVTAGGKNMTIDFRIRGEEITGLILPYPGAWGQMFDFYGTGYSGRVTWSPSATPFQPGIVYTGTFILTAVDSYTFTGMTGTFTVSGATSVTASDNTGGTLKLTVVFPETVSPQAVTVAVKKDGSSWTGHGKSFALYKDGTSNYVLNSSGYNASVLPGTYDIYDGTIDTGVDITVSKGGANSATVNYYTVTFKSQDGNTTLNTQTVLTGKNAVYGGTTPDKAADAQYSYAFSKWVTVANGSDEATLNNIAMPTTVYASFVPTLRSYTITWKKDESTPIDATTAAYDATPTHSDPVKPGYKFDGWMPGIVSVTCDATYTAKWTIETYNISYQLNGGNVSEANPASYTIESTAITLNNPARDGYSFTGWSGTDLIGNTNQSVTITSNSTGAKAYTANWKANVPSAPDASIVMEKIGTILTISTTVGYEYSLNGTSWYSGTNGSYTFHGLTPGHSYNLVCRKGEVTTEGSASEASDASPALSVTIKNGAPAAPTLAFAAITENSVTITAVAGAEYSKDNGTSWQDSNEFTNLEAATKYFFAIRIKETGDTLAGNQASEEKYTILPTVRAEGASYGNMTQAEATSEDVIKEALKITADTAINDNSVDVTINKVSYTEPVAGTSADPSGADGSYTFTIKLSKGGQTDETAEKTIIISATAFTGVTDVQAVEAAKTAIVGGTVNVAFGATQEDKTAAVQSYINSLLTGNASGVMATVNYISEDNYSVAISKGSVDDTTTITMTIIEGADPDIATVADAKNAAESAAYSDMTQGAAIDETVIEAALKATAETAVNDGTVIVTVDKVSYTEPIAGTSANPSGTDGSYVFTITVSKGSQTQMTTQKTIKISATAFTGVTDVQAVEAAKTAMVGGTVNVAFGATQADKTAAVQSYINSLLTGNASGVMATVNYISEDNYSVAISKGSVDDTTTITMTVIEGADPDIATVADAKDAAESAAYSDMTQGAAIDETVIEAALKATAEAAVNDGTVIVTVDKVSYTEPIAGTSANPSGTDGSYVFTVTVSKGSQTLMTTQKTIIISATAFTGVTDVQAVEAAKTAMVGGTVNVAFGATQADKTAAVQSYINSLLTGNASGVMATVNYISGNNYSVAISKGSVDDTTTVTMTIIEGADPDVATVNNAANAAENANYRNMTQAKATSETVVENTVKSTATTAVNDDSVTVTINKQSYTEPVAGTSANPSGTDGSYVFSVTVSKGSQTQTTTQKAITITATAYQVIPTYEISGTVKDDGGSNISGASVMLMKGNTQIGTQGVTTDSNGEFTITGVPNGAYNLVIAHTDGTTVTVKVEITDADYIFSSAIVLPPGKTNSIVEVKPSTPDIVVGNLDAQFDSADITYAQDPNNTVEIKLIVEKKTAGTVQMDATEIASIANNKTVEFYLDLSVTKTLTVSDAVYSTTPMSILPSTIEIIIPLPQELQGKNGLTVYRMHSGEAAALPNGSANAVDGEYFVVEGDIVTIYTKKFSLYAIGYTTPATPPDNDKGGSSGRRSPSSTITVEPKEEGKITIEPSEGGKITISDDKKTATVTPDDGYVIADVIVDGRRIGGTEKYTFTDSSSHKITASFVRKSALPYYSQNNGKIYIGFSAIEENLYKYIATTGVNVEFGENPKIFTDNTIAWAKPSIDFVTEREIFLGTTHDKFSPNESMTRAMFVTVIGRLYERSYGSVSGTGNFSDVDANAYYARYVAWANEKGIIKGIGENKFAPDEKVTREQMAVIILNFADFLNKADVTYSSLGYADSANISSWAIDGAKYCQETKVITGREGGSFIPQGNATRAEVAAVIERFVKIIVK